MVLKLENFTIDQGNLKNDLIYLFKKIRPSWNSEEIVHEVVSGGFTNKLLLCYTNTNVDDKVLVRLFGNNTDKLIDRNYEVENTEKLCKAGLSVPIYCHFVNGIAYGYVVGEPMNENNVRDPAIYKLIGAHMAKFHSLPLEPNPKSILFPMLKTILKMMPDSKDPEKNEKFKGRMPSKDIILKELDELVKIVDGIDSRVVFSHNDCLLGNIIYDKKKNCVHFIDFEYSGPNYQAFDIANHFCEFAGVEDYKPELYPDETLQKDWIQKYLTEWHKIQNLGAVTDQDVENMFHFVDDMSMLPNLLWSVWAFAQADMSSIDFDYLQYGIDRLEDYFKRKDKLMKSRNI